MKNVRIIASLVRVILSVIRSIQQDKGGGGVISARPVKRPSVQQREHHTTDSTNHVGILMKWLK